MLLTSEFDYYSSDALHLRVLLVDAFNKAWRNAGRPVSDELIRLQARGLLRTQNPDRFRRKAEWVLHQADLLGRQAYPELAVKWAAYVANVARQHSSPLIEDAIEVALVHAPAAFPHDRKGVRDSLAMCWLSSHNQQTQLRVERVGYSLEPALLPGPWGLRDEGIDYLLAEMERDRSLWERFGDWKHRVLHPPGPDDITIS